MFSAATWLGGRGQRFESRVGVWLGSEQVTPTKAGFNPDGPNAFRVDLPRRADGKRNLSVATLAFLKRLEHAKHAIFQR